MRKLIFILLMAAVLVGLIHPIALSEDYSVYDMSIPSLNGRRYTEDDMNMSVYWVQIQMKATGRWYQGDQWDCTGNLGDHTMQEIASFMKSRGYSGHTGYVEAATKTLNFYLPVENVPEIEIDARQTVWAEDIHASLDRVVLIPTKLETQVELFYHTDSRQSADQLLKYRFVAVDPTTLDFVDAGSNSDGPEILGADDQCVYLHDAWTLSSAVKTDALYLQLLPVYTWAEEGMDRDQGLSDVQIIEISITDKN